MAAAAFTAVALLLLPSPDHAIAAARSSSPPPAQPRLVLEEGYAVSTLLDGNKPGAPFHPYSLHPFPDPRRRDRLFLLDSANSAFYTLSLPVSQDSEIRRLSGNGVAGFSDGDATAAMFKNPRSFAVDSRGNVYVADRGNFAIRKISASGMTTTIAGGYSQDKTGHVDGPAQNATFSNDFELAFVPKICSLLISDRANRLIRQIVLKPDDCAHETPSGLGTMSVSLIAVTCLLFGLVIGLIAHSLYVSRRETGEHSSTKTWKVFLTPLGTLAVMLLSDNKSAVAKSAPWIFLHRLVSLSLSYLFCMFRIHREAAAPIMVKKPPSLLDSDVPSSHGAEISTIFTDQLKGFLSLDGDAGTSDVKPEDKEGKTPDRSNPSLDDLIRANILEFTDKAKQEELTEQSSACGSSLLKRRPRGGDGP